MKKATLFFSPRLDELIKTEERWRKLPLFGYALTIVVYVVQIAALRYMTRLPLPLVAPSNGSREIVSELACSSCEPTNCVLVGAYNEAQRIEAHMRTGIADASIGIDIKFFRRQGKDPFVVLEAGVDSDGLRLLRFAQLIT